MNLVRAMPHVGVRTIGSFVLTRDEALESMHRQGHELRFSRGADTKVPVCVRISASPVTDSVLRTEMNCHTPRYSPPHPVEVS